MEDKGSKGYKKLFEVQLNRRANEDWGIRIDGGWQQGEWLWISEVDFNSPVSRLGRDAVRTGDFLVQINDQLTFFMTKSEVEKVLKDAGTNVILKLERGSVSPMSPKAAEGCLQQGTGRNNYREKVTIVLDKEKGIFAKGV